MWSAFQPGSSPVDWCEENYIFSPSIAEFVNTVSNIPFFILPPLLIYLFKDYGKVINPAIHVIWVLLIVVGLSSAYFHATLSLAGQLLDELAILWVLFVAISIFFPRRLFPHFLNNDRRRLGMGAAALALIGTALALIHPVVNAFALMTLAIPIMILFVHEVRREKNDRIQRLCIRCLTVWFVAVFCWFNDRLLCDTWLAIKFPYLHGLWHIFICITSYTTCVLLAYCSVREERPEKRAVLRYWPRDDFELGIPYVLIKTHNDDINDDIC